MVRFLGLGLIVAGLIAGVASRASADEQLMVLWPKQRASHQELMETQKQHYNARGKEYVDHIYASGGETPVTPDTELVPSEITPQPVQVDDVARIIRDEAAPSNR